jgi:nitrite reductase (NO-forming)
MSAPLAAVRPSLAVAGLYACAVLAWVALPLPGGRWFAVHLFTLGVLTTLVAALTAHFAGTLLHAPGRPGAAARLALLQAGALLLLAGLPTGQRWSTVAGATALVVAVGWLYLDLRRMRRASLTGRFAFVVRTYERATGAFLHGAVLGALMGTGLLGGAWYGAARLAHLHVNVLGWGGLPLLATLVFFGPTVMRARIEPGADEAAAPALRRAATALTVAVLALLVTGAGGAVALSARLVAAAGLAVYAAGAVSVCLPVLRVARHARPSAQGWMLAASAGWFLVAVWADVLVVATGRLRLLDAVGAALLAGVLGQAILGASGYLAPLAVPGPDARAAVRRRLETLPRLRPAVLNLGVALLVAGVPGGWVLVVGAALAQLVLIGVAVLGQALGDVGEQPVER